MKKTFKHYLSPNEDEIEQIWKEGLVVLDTNVLLDFYCYGPKTLNSYYDALEAVKAKQNLWLPHQVGLEFHENRIRIINKQLALYDKVINLIASTETKIIDVKNTAPTHPVLDFDKIGEDYRKATLQLKRNLTRQREKHPDHLGEDEVLSRIQTIYDDSIIGEAYTEEQLTEIEREGEDRYEKRIPPGYKDQGKKESEDKPNRRRKYGDLIMWKQILDKASQKNAPIILVTNDEKEDWIQFAKDGRKIGPQPPLRKEIIEISKSDLIIYSADEFLSEAQKRYGLKIDEGSVDEVKKYRQLELNRLTFNRAFDTESLYSYLHSTTGISQLSHSYRHLLFKARLTVKRILVSIEEGSTLGVQQSARLIECLNELRAMYAVARRQGPDNLSFTLEILNQTERLIRRAVHISDNHDSELSAKLIELGVMNKNIIYLINEQLEPGVSEYEQS